MFRFSLALEVIFLNFDAKPLLLVCYWFQCMCTLTRMYCVHLARVHSKCLHIQLMRVSVYKMAFSVHPETFLCQMYHCVAAYIAILCICEINFRAFVLKIVERVFLETYFCILCSFANKIVNIFSRV